MSTTTGGKLEGKTVRKLNWLAARWSSKWRLSFLQVFKYGDALDLLLMVVGSMLMCCVGASLPLHLLFFGEMVNNFIGIDLVERQEEVYHMNDTQKAPFCLVRFDPTEPDYLTDGEMQEMIKYRYLIAFCTVSVGTFLTAFLGMFVWKLTANRQITRIRRLFFEAVMHQYTFHADGHNSEEPDPCLTRNFEKLTIAFGEKIGMMFQWSTALIGGYAIAFYSGWTLTLVVMATMPCLICLVLLFEKLVKKFIDNEVKSCVEAVETAEEALTNIKMIAAFSGEERAEKKYLKSISSVLRDGLKRSCIEGVSSCVVCIAIFGIFSLTFWYGAELYREGAMQPGAVFRVFAGIMMGTVSISNIGPVLEYLRSACNAVADLYDVIDSIPNEDVSLEKGLIPASLEGDIELIDVKSFDDQRKTKLFGNLSLKVKSMESVAVVGREDSPIGTLRRLFYGFSDYEGQVLIDHREMKEYDLSWLRDQICVMSGEPVLFHMTIADNIKLGCRRNVFVSEEEVERAAKQANCYDFINQLPQGFQTVVDDKTNQMSAVARHKIVMARAFLRDPAILILDYTTSIPDYDVIVQTSLNELRKNRTTIIMTYDVTHAQWADRTAVFHAGSVQEGADEELMSKDDGLYYKPSNGLSEGKTTNMEYNYNSNLENHYARLTNLQPEDNFRRCSAFRRSARAGSTRSIREGVASAGFVISVENQTGSDDDDDDDDADSSEVCEAAKNQEPTEERRVNVIDVIKLSKPEWCWLTLGSIASVINGLALPSFSLLMSEIIDVFARCDQEAQRHEMHKKAAFIVLVGVITAAATTTQKFSFNLAGGKLTIRLRKQLFSTIIRQKMAYFEEKGNDLDSLKTMLGLDASSVNVIATEFLGLIIQSGTAVIAILVIGFIHAWELTLVMVVCVAASTFISKMLSNIAHESIKSDRESIRDSIKKIRDVERNADAIAWLNKRSYFTDDFWRHLQIGYRQYMKKAFRHSLIYGVVQGVPYTLSAICFGIGSILIFYDSIPWRDEEIPFYYIFRVFAAFTYGAMQVSKAVLHLPDVKKVTQSAGKMAALLKDNVILPLDPSHQTAPNNGNGKITFSDVKFAYPNSKLSSVINRFALHLEDGETVALVGPAGCGKTTVLNLLEGFYDVNYGSLTIHGKPIQQWNIVYLRQSIGIVPQDVVLLDGTIADNIAYGDNSKVADINQVIDAAKQASLHDFISSLPMGYDTEAKSEQVQLNKGQIRRLGIARALIRNPAILLVDEVKPALDGHDKEAELKSIKKAVKGRTSLVATSCLSLTKHVDKIAVIDQEKVVEFGTHKELFALRGAYFDLISNHQIK